MPEDHREIVVPMKFKHEDAPGFRGSVQKIVTSFAYDKQELLSGDNEDETQQGRRGGATTDSVDVLCVLFEARTLSGASSATLTSCEQLIKVNLLLASSLGAIALNCEDPRSRSRSLALLRCCARHTQCVTVNFVVSYHVYISILHTHPHTHTHAYYYRYSIISRVIMPKINVAAADGTDNTLALARLISVLCKSPIDVGLIPAVVSIGSLEGNGMDIFHMVCCGDDDLYLWQAVVRQLPFKNELLRLLCDDVGGLRTSQATASKLALAILDLCTPARNEVVRALTGWRAAVPHGGSWFPLSAANSAVFSFLVPLADAIFQGLDFEGDPYLTFQVTTAIAAAAGTGNIRNGIAMLRLPIQRRFARLACALAGKGFEVYELDEMKFWDTLAPVERSRLREEADLLSHVSASNLFVAPEFLDRDEDYAALLQSVAEAPLTVALLKMCEWNDRNAVATQTLGPHCLVDFELKVDRQRPGETVLFDLDSLLSWALESPDLQEHMRGAPTADDASGSSESGEERKTTHPAVLPWLAVIAQIEQLLHFTVVLAGFQVVVAQFDLHRPASAEGPSTMLMREVIFHHLKRWCAASPRSTSQKTKQQGRARGCSAEFIRTVSFTSPFDSRFMTWFHISPPVACVLNTTGPSALLSWAFLNNGTSSADSIDSVIGGGLAISRTHILDARTLRIGQASLFASRAVLDDRESGVTHRARCIKLRYIITKRIHELDAAALQPSHLLMLSSAAVGGGSAAPFSSSALLSSSSSSSSVEALVAITEKESESVMRSVGINELIQGEFNHCFDSATLLRARLARVKDLPAGMAGKLLRFSCLLATSAHLLCEGSDAQGEFFK